MNDIERLWLELGNIPIVESNNRDLILDDNFHIFTKGTSLEEVWDWFDENHYKGVAYLMFNKSKLN